MNRKEEIAAAKSQSHWTARQRNHLRRMVKIGATIAYYNTDRKIARLTATNAFLNGTHKADPT